MSSESEAEDLPNSKVELAQDFQGKKKSRCALFTFIGSNVAIRLYEVGPRMRLGKPIPLSLGLLKIEEGFCSGNVVFHQHVKKTNSRNISRDREP